MAHGLDFSLGKAAIAYAGETPWHKYGDCKPAGEHWSLDQWCNRACVNYTVQRVQAFAADLNGNPIEVPDTFFNRRTDTGRLLGEQTFTDRRVELQPRELVKFVYDIVAADERFDMQVVGAIRHGAQIWATAGYKSLDIAGERHQSFLILRTGFDGSLATHAYMTMVRGVCANTLAAGFDKRAMITIRHTQKFDARAVAKELARLAQQVDQFKQIGDALAQDVMAQEETVNLFKTLLAIPHDAKQEDISTRKLNQFNDFARAYDQSVREGAQEGTSWAALQAVTRFVDHDRTARGASDITEDEKRFTSAQWGSGADLKAQAMGILMPRIKDRVLVSA